MRYILLILAIVVSPFAQANECSPLLDVNVKTLNDNTAVNLCEAYQGKVLLVVNTASRCAYTDQYDALEKLYEKYREQGLVVLGFPSNDFGNQEPGTEKEIKTFCRLTYGVQFPMFSKARVTERNADPLYQRLGNASGTFPKWNFHKYLISSKGELVSDYLSPIDPFDSKIIDAIENELNKL